MKYQGPSRPNEGLRKTDSCRTFLLGLRVSHHVNKVLYSQVTNSSVMVCDNLEDKIPDDEEGAKGARAVEKHPRSAGSFARPLQLLVTSAYVLGCEV